MKNDQKLLSNQDTLLAEIFLIPSTECIENRFTESAEAADCSGHCQSPGGCKTM